jgi:glycosyltransferase involved in cell wall biosynthesis
MPLALIEAMLAARAVVAADVASVGEAIRHEVNGLLVPPDDPGALAAAISRLLADAALRENLGRRARDTALAQFTADAMAAKYLALYRELVP